MEFRKPISTGGDPYYCHCAKTTRLLGEALNLDGERLKMTFQSRFGRAEWLKPYTAETVRELASRGVKRVVVVTPGFAADCLETLEEIGVENAAYFREAGGERFAAIPCLNDSVEGVAVIEAVARRELEGLGRVAQPRSQAEPFVRSAVETRSQGRVPSAISSLALAG